MARLKDPSNTRSVLVSAEESIRVELGFSEFKHIEIDGEECLLAQVVDRPVILVYSPLSGDGISAAMEELAIQMAATVPVGPADYVWVTLTGKLGEGFMYCWLPGQECPVSALPSRENWQRDALPAVTRAMPKADPAKFKELQREFDELHERIYAAREPIDGSNDLTAQLCKCIFLKMHLERNPDFRIPPSGKLLEEVFKGAYIRGNGASAVEEIKLAFGSAKALPQYCVKDDTGRDFQIFDSRDFIRFNQPETFARIADMLNRHQLTSPEETGLEDDILGRAFDVMLRAKFESKGGMGIYLTPQQVRDAMVQLAFFDILREDPGTITRRDPRTGDLAFRVGDPCCGSGGFLVSAMREVRKHVEKLVGLSDRQRKELLADIFSRGFEGADNSPNMVLLARINMSLHGDPKARVFEAKNSLMDEFFVPETFDLILTNPPFKKGGIKEEEQADLLQTFRSDIDGSKPMMSGAGLAMGSKPDSNGVWKAVRSVDPAVLFIDRCLQLLKPGGRLLIVVPDGILCNSGDRYVREYIMGRKDESTSRFVGGKAVVRAVISLPQVTFRLSGAGAKTSFLYLQKKRPGDEQGSVFMAVANEVGFDVKQNKEVITGVNDLVKIVEAYKQGPPQPQVGGESVQ
jgi:type I restriction enzyme M protein